MVRGGSDGFAVLAEFLLKTDGIFAIILQLKHSCFGRLKRNLENFCVQADSEGNVSSGAFSPCLVPGFSRASLDTRQKMAPSSFAAIVGRGRKGFCKSRMRRAKSRQCDAFKASGAKEVVRCT